MDRVQDFLAERGLAQSTQANYSQILQDVGAWMQDQGLAAGQLRARHFDAWLATKVWLNSTEINALCALRAYLDWRFPKGHHFTKKIKRIEPEPGRALDHGQVLELLAAARARSSRDHALVILMLETGLRSSEACRLKVSDVDLKACKLSVLQKGGRIRHSVFTRDASAAIETWIHDSRGLRVMYEGRTYPHLFLALGGIRPGRPLTRDGLRSVFRRLGDAAELGLLSPHDLRRTFCTEAVARGANLRLLMVQGGWSQLAMVQRYSASLQPEAFRDFLPSYNGREKRPG